MNDSKVLRSTRVSRSSRSSIKGWLFVTPAVIVLVLFFLVPLGYAAVMSTKDWPLLGSDRPTNFPQNYTQIPQNELFMNAIWFTLKYTLIIALILLVLSTLMALLVQEEKSRASGFFRTVYFLPVVTGLSTASLIFLGFLNPTIGPVNKALAIFGVNPDWLGTPNLALASTVLMMTWRFAGFYMIILLSGLQAIPKEIYESAAVDGAGKWAIFKSITLPLLRSTISLCLILILTGGMVAFEQFYILTAGGPDNTTVTIVMTIFREAFSQFRLGPAAAMSMVLLACLVLMNSIQLGYLQRNNEGQSR